MTNIRKQKISDLKNRVLKVKKRLPEHGISSLFFFRYSALYEKTKYNKIKLNNILQLRTVDEDITEKLEELAELLK